MFVVSAYTLVGTKFPYFVKKISTLVSFLSSAGIKAQNGPIKCVSLVSLFRLIKKLFLYKHPRIHTCGTK